MTKEYSMLSFAVLSFTGRRAFVGIASSAVLVVLGLVASPVARSHGAQIATGGGEKGPVHLTLAQQQTLGVQVVAADLRPLSELLYLNGEVRLLPDRQADVSTRVSGQVTALYVALGSVVRPGQRLARVQSRLLGDPPPSVDIVAPRAGTVDALDVTLGQSVEPATTLMRLSDHSRVNIVARVYEEDLGKVRVGQAVAVRTLSYPDRAFTGRIDLVGPTLDPQSRTVEVWIGLDNPDGALKPNLFARAGVALRESKATLAIPTTAVLEANGERFVFVRQKGEFDRIEIRTGAQDDRFTEVIDGLVPGDEVVTQGNREIYTQWLVGGSLNNAED